MSAFATNGWAEAMAAFDRWADLPAPERAAWLQTLAAADRELHARVSSLIVADEDSRIQAFLTPDTTSPTAAAALEGQRLGPWLVERLIGSGGMGHVWLARRTDGLYDGRAAIKLMRLASADHQSAARFAREGRLLGRLSHPNIARLLDAGVTDEGERYLVLEYIEGERIDRWCDARRLTVQQRLTLFIDVCRAVAHAHENLVVHRDLKPSNIFVTDSGAVKLLDFGIAKLMEDDGAESADITREAGVVLTPQYAAPEQVNGGPVSTATDVYGLGLVLFGLLGGSRPYPSTPGDADVARPLWRLPDDAAAAQGFAEARSTTVKALQASLHGDLSVVVAKAIKAAPAERYRAAADLIDELQRVLAHRPVAALPDSVGYRARRYVQRHAFGVGAASLLALALIAGTTGTLLKQREATREAARAVAVERFLIDLFEEARSSVKQAGVQTREATINDMLLAGVSRIGQSFAQQPEIRDEVFQVLVELVSDTGDRQQITDLAQARVAAARASFGAEDARTAPAEVMLGAVLLNFGDTTAAQPLLAHARLLLDRAGDHSSIERARLWRWEALLDQQTDVKPPWAEHPIRRSVELLRARYPDDDELLSALAMLPTIACSYGQTQEALAGAEELYARTLKRHGGDNLYVDEANLLRGQLTMHGDNPSDAVVPMEQALAGLRRHVGDKSPNVAVTRAELATAYLVAGRADDSRRAWAAAEQSRSADHAGDRRMAAMFVEYGALLEKIRAGERQHCGDS